MSTPFPPAAPPTAASSPSPTAPRSVPAGNGATWWGEAWRLFTPAVAMWLLILVIMIVLSIVLSFIPVIGHLASNLLYPVLTGGLMLGCRAIDRGQPLTINHLFAGFSERAGPLFMLGAIYLGLTIAIVATVAGILLVTFGAAVFTQMFRHQQRDQHGRVAERRVHDGDGGDAAVPGSVPAADHGNLVRACAHHAARGANPGRR